MDEQLTLYHGSDKIIDKPLFGFGKPDNDYGSGFYTTEDIEKAKAWAVVNGNNNAYCNKYTIDTTSLKILDFSEYGVLAWIAEIAYNRGTKSKEAEIMADELIKYYKLDTSSYDIIKGYRADDSYTEAVEAFLKNQLNIDEITRLFYKGELGEQIFIKSEKAFNLLNFEEATVVENKEKYINQDYIIRKSTQEYLNKRLRQIQIDGFVPSEIIARNAITEYFQYNKEYNYYTPNSNIININDEPNNDELDDNVLDDFNDFGRCR